MSCRGLARKVAERVVRELSEKLTELPNLLLPEDLRLDGRETAVLDETVSALMNLGYDHRGQACRGRSRDLC
jgi:Holliday junction resolvasome RuvABC DNA-binding subunit